MASPEKNDYKNNPYLIQIRLNEWINSKTYRGCTIQIIGQNHYKLLYGTEIQYTAWVEIFKVDNRWVYTPLGNNEYQGRVRLSV